MKQSGPTTGARCGIVLAHGRGGKAQDILGLIAAAGLKDVAAIAPQAPGNSWWPTSFLSPTDTLAPFVAAGIAAMDKAVSALKEQGVPANRIWLGGFSQGACLALETFARAGEGLAGVFGLSGGLIGTSDKPGAPQDALYGHRAKAFDYPGHRDGAKVWISVHERDPHIPILRARESDAALRGMGAKVELNVYPGAGHSVMQADLVAMRRLMMT